MDINEVTISINFDTFRNRRRISTIRTSALRLSRLFSRLRIFMRLRKIRKCRNIHNAYVHNSANSIMHATTPYSHEYSIFQLPPVVFAFDCHLYLHRLHSFFFAHNAALIQRHKRQSETTLLSGILNKKLNKKFPIDVTGSVMVQRPTIIACSLLPRVVFRT